MFGDFVLGEMVGSFHTTQTPASAANKEASKIFLAIKTKKSKKKAQWQSLKKSVQFSKLAVWRS